MQINNGCYVTITVDDGSLSAIGVGVCLQMGRGSASRGVCPTPHVDRMTDASENITFPCGR